MSAAWTQDWPSEGLWSLYSEDQFGPQKGSGNPCLGGLLDTTGCSRRDPWLGEVDSALGRVTGSCRTGGDLKVADLVEKSSSSVWGRLPGLWAVTPARVSAAFV